MGVRYTHLGLTVLAASIAMPVVVSAAGRQIEEVVVTAERKESSIQDTSISITAFTGDMLENFGIRNQEDLQNFIPATTIQPYDATIRGVGRVFRALGGDPGVAAYVNNIYSEDFVAASAQTFWDTERIEVLRGPQGTLYGRNAVGGAINIIYADADQETDYAFKMIGGNFGTKEYYGMLNGALTDTLSARINFASRDRDGVVKDIGGFSDIDGIGTRAGAISLNWTPTDNLQFKLRVNAFRNDRSFGGANGGGLVVLNEEGASSRNTTNIVPGYRRIDTGNTNIANYDQNNWYDASQPIINFTDPTTGAAVQAQHNRLGVDVGDFDGFQNAAASLDGFNNTSAASAARYNDCVFSDDISGEDLCAATNGLNQEEIDYDGIAFSASWDVSDALRLVYLYGDSQFDYARTTDDDNTASTFSDRQFYVNHEPRYSSHEFQAFYEFSDTLSFTSGIFFYDAVINQRGDFYSSVGEDRFTNAYQDNTGIAGAVFGNGPMTTLHAARDACQGPNAAPSCAVNFSVNNTDVPDNNLIISQWFGDDGTNPDLDVKNGINTVGSDLLYQTRTERDAFAFYTQGVWDINETFTLTFGIRYAEDEITAEENLFRYTEGGGGAFAAGAFGINLATYNRINGGLVPDANGLNGERGTELAVNGGIPIAISVYRPFKRTDKKTTGRLNLDWNLNDDTLLYLSATSGYRSGGYNLVFFSETPTYDPEELIAYEFGYKMQLLDNTLQLNGSFYYYDYQQIHVQTTEVSGIGGTTTSVVEAPGARISGAEAEALWFVSEAMTLGGNFSYTPSEYTEDKFINDTGSFDTPESLFGTFAGLTKNIKGNQLLQVPEWKYTLFTSYNINLDGGSMLELFGTLSWIDDVYYSAFESEEEKAESYYRTDLRATFTSPSRQWKLTGFVNNVFDDIGVTQVLNNGEDEFFRQSSGITTPRLYGVELSYQLGQ